MECLHGEAPAACLIRRGVSAPDIDGRYADDDLLSAFDVTSATTEALLFAMFAADMSHRYFLSRAAWNKRVDDTARVLLLIMSSAAWASLVALAPAAAPYLAFAAAVLASLTVIVRFHDQASTYCDGRGGVQPHPQRIP